MGECKSARCARPVRVQLATPGGRANFAAAAQAEDERVFRTVGLIVKHGDERVAATVETLVSFLRERSVDIRLDAGSARGLPGFELPLTERGMLARSCDLVIIVGGDGTFLNAACSLVGADVRLLGVNLGRLGFLTDIMPAEMTERLHEIFSGQFSEEERFLLHAVVERDGEVLAETNALNEVVVHKWNLARLIEFETWIESRLVNRQRSDGLIVSTPTGSTAYALSGGGPILYPSLDAVVLVPICPHTLSNRPIVVDATCRIEVVLRNQARPEAQLTSDGQCIAELRPGDRVRVARRREPLRLVHPPEHDYFATLRAKLHWGREL